MRATVPLLLGVVFGVMACTEILGVAGQYEPIGVSVCACDNDALERFGATARECQDTIAEKLRDGGPAAAQAWIEQFDARGCSDCKKLNACLEIAPLCAESNEACVGLSDCCEGLGCNASGTCVACSEPGGACSADTPCCGDAFACDEDTQTCKRCFGEDESCDSARDCCGFGREDVYCDKSSGRGVCRNERECLHDGDTCLADTDCCGYGQMIPEDPDVPDGPKVSAGLCVQSGGSRRCVERCNPRDPDNCIGCCARQVTTLSPNAGQFVCSGGASCSPPNCVDLPDVDRCPEGTLCTKQCVGLLCTFSCL